MPRGAMRSSSMKLTMLPLTAPIQRNTGTLPPSRMYLQGGRVCGWGVGVRAEACLRRQTSDRQAEREAADQSTSTQHQQKYGRQ